ncbi:MAG: methylated-DNA--[protein]-cysteine S-methyltransferase [Gammaproteobacteria bacterium]
MLVTGGATANPELPAGGCARVTAGGALITWGWQLGHGWRPPLVSVTCTAALSALHPAALQACKKILPSTQACTRLKSHIAQHAGSMHRAIRAIGYNCIAGASNPLTDVDYLGVETPLGAFVVAARNGALKGGWFEGQKYFPEISAQHGWRAARTPLLRDAEQQLQDYFRGALTVFDLPLAPEGTAFQQQVWTALRAVPCGETTTYAELAHALGKPGAFHPVGAAVARNPISVIIPCHRALGSDGSLTGYAGGLARKQWLLGHERGERGLFD